MIKFIGDYLVLELLRERRSGQNYHENFNTRINIRDIIGKWNKVRLIIDTGDIPAVQKSFNEKHIYLNRYHDEIGQFIIPDCGKPHFKFGIYRPGNSYRSSTLIGNKRSIVDFDKIQLKEIK